MSIFDNIMSSIFGHGAKAQATMATSEAAKPSASSTMPQSQVDSKRCLKLMTQTKEKLDWCKSIVDLIKLLGPDSSPLARRELAKELHYAGDTNDLAIMNIWLHKQVMIKLAENVHITLARSRASAPAAPPVPDEGDCRCCETWFFIDAGKGSLNKL